MSQPKIFGFAGSTYVRTVLFAAAEKGVACTLEPLEFRSDAHRALHPFAKMPAMRHRDIQLFETAAIAVYLDEAFDGPSLQPAAALDRATMWQWISAANAYFYSAFVGATLAEGGHDAEAGEERERSLTLLADALRGRSYLVGTGSPSRTCLWRPCLPSCLRTAARRMTRWPGAPRSATGSTGSRAAKATGGLRPHDDARR